MTDGPYTRIYHQLADEYPAIYDDAATLGTFVQLLIQADQAWPTAPFLPAFVEPERLDALTACDLVTMDGRRYRMKGLDKERRKRRKAAMKGNRARYADPDADADALSGAIAGANAHANAHANGVPSRAEKSREEPSREKTRRTARDRSRGLTPVSDVLGGRA